MEDRGNVDAGAGESPAAPRMDDETLGFAAEFFGALASPTRLRIVECLAGGERMVTDIAANLGLAQAGVSQNLAVLGKAGIVAARPQGSMRWYRLRGPRVEAILRLLKEFRDRNKDAIAADSAAEADIMPVGSRSDTEWA